MPNLRGLHSHDLKILTAKAVCFRTVVRHEERLFIDNRGSESLRLRAGILGTLSNLELFAAASKNNSDTPAVLEEIAQSFEILLQVFYSDPEIRSKFIETFRLEASKYPSIEEELKSWLQAMLHYSKRYLGFLGTTPPEIELVLGAPELCDPPLDPVISAVTHSTGAARRITVYLRSDSLDFESYFRIPSVLSHEFWCHSLSNIEDLTEGKTAIIWRGCDPQDAWEEGWMDFLQNLIFRASDFPLPAYHLPCLLPPLYRASAMNEALRADPANGIQRASGWNTAMFVASFLRQYYARFTPDDLLIDLSLKLNSLKELPARKARVVTFFRRHLAPPDFGADSAVSYDRNMIGRRNLLFKLLASSLIFGSDGTSVSIDILKLLEIVDIKSSEDDIFRTV